MTAPAAVARCRCARLRGPDPATESAGSPRRRPSPVRHHRLVERTQRQFGVIKPRQRTVVQLAPRQGCQRPPGLDAPDDREIDLITLDEALGRLAQLSARQARVVELRFFAGLDIDETATALGVSEGTVKGDWRLARAWLERELAGGAA